GECRYEILTIRDVARRFDHGGASRLIDTRRISREHVAFEREGAGAAAAAQLLIFAAPAFAAETPVAESLEEGRGVPNLTEALRAKIARDFREIGTGCQFPVGRDAAVLRAAGAACLIIEDRRIGIGGVDVPHE